MALKVASFRMDGGVVTDRSSLAIPANAWTTASNMQFREGMATRVKSYTSIGGACTVCAPRHLVPINTADSYYLSTLPSQIHYAGTPYSGTTLKIGKLITSTSAHTDVTPAGWGAAAIGGQWTGGVMNGLPYLGHPAYAPVTGAVPLVGAGTYATLAGWAAAFAAGDGALAVRHHKEFLIAMGRTTPGTGAVDGDVVNWSARAASQLLPVVWAPAAGNAAGNAILPGDGTLIDGAPLGEVFMVYKRRAVWAMRYVGGNYIFNFTKVLNGIGALTQNCIANIGSQHIFLADDDVFLWNGAGQPTSVLDGKVKKLLVGLIDDTNFATCWVKYMPRQKEVWVCFPSSNKDYPTKAIVVDLSEGKCGYREFRTGHYLTHAGYAQELTATLTGLQGDTVMAYHDSSVASAGRILQIDSADQALGGDVSNYVTRDVLDLGAPGYIKKVRWIRPWIKLPTGTVTVTCAAGGTMQPNATPVYTGTGSFNSATSDKVDLLAEGRYINVSFSATSGAPWEIAGFDIGYELGGLE